MEITVLRREYGINFTRGEIYIDNELFGYTLEDALRPIKIAKETAIKAGRYPIILSYSVKYKTLLPEILGVPGFEGIRIHGGNNNNDTEGCILIAENKHEDDMIYGSLSGKLVEIFEGDDLDLHWIEIVNC